MPRITGFLILLLHTLASVPSTCISIKLCSTVVNIESEFLGEKFLLDISGAKQLAQMDL